MAHNWRAQSIFGGQPWIDLEGAPYLVGGGVRRVLVVQVVLEHEREGVALGRPACELQWHVHAVIRPAWELHDATARETDVAACSQPYLGHR